MVLDITKGQIYTKGWRRKTRIVNIYDNKLGKIQIWEGPDRRVRRAIQDILWESIIKRQMLILGDMNAYSSIWNPHC